jgi:hypothetical protein
MYTMNTEKKEVTGIQVEGKVLYNTTDTARLLNITVPTARKYIKDGRLPGQRIKSRTYVSADAIRSYLNQLEIAYLQ